MSNPLPKVPKKNLLLTKKKTTKDPFGQKKKVCFPPKLPNPTAGPSYETKNSQASDPAGGLGCPGCPPG